MTIETHQKDGMMVAEFTADETIIRTTDDALELLGNHYYKGYDAMILYQNQIIPRFFDLRTGLAGEILQKFAQYQMRLVIIGAFHTVESESLRQFIEESNKGSHVHFTDSLPEALKKLEIQ